MIGVQVIGTNEVIAKLNQYSIHMQQQVEREIEMSARQTLADAQKNAPHLGGGLRGSGTVKESTNGKMVEFNAKYAKATEFGRPPGIWPPLQPLIDWVHKRGLGGVYSIKSRRMQGSADKRANDEKSAAIAIQRTIKARGIKARPFLHPAFEAERPKFIRRLQSLVK